MPAPASGRSEEPRWAAELQCLSRDVKRDATWGSLLDAYLHLGQGANALLPGYEGTYGSTGDELATGSKDLRAAEAGLPSACFTATPSP